METNKIEIEVPEGKTAKWIDGVLKLVDEETKDTRPVTERIKTFEDACRELGDSNPLVVQYREIFNCFLDGADERNSSDLIAYMKLRIICAALNEGWDPKFTIGELRYYPWFCLYAKDEVGKMDEDERNKLVLWGGSAYRGARAGFASARSTCVPSAAAAHFGSRLCLKNRDLAIYCGNQFSGIWVDLVLIRKP